MELCPDGALLQVRHSEFVLLFNKGLRNKNDMTRDEMQMVFLGEEPTVAFFKKNK